MCNKVEAIDTRQHAIDIERWLAPTSPSKNINEARGQRHEGTGNWFLECPQFQKWLNGSGRHLWLHGPLGCGKTVLSTIIIDCLKSEESLETLSFFFDFADLKKQKPDHMVRSLVMQLYQLGGPAVEKLDDFFRMHNQGQDQPSPSDLEEILHAMIRDSGSLCIIIDALDECSMREELISFIRSFVKTSKARLIATGRPEAQLLSHLTPLFGNQNSMPLDKELIKVDIHSYVTERVWKGGLFERWARLPSILTKIRDEVVSKADG